ncbi:MAG: hypothetical protein M1831_000077 [Alyxoria varia]|nr:MAG: hypothetical protein M1831_000077 [Alyxoria varia]
MNYFKLPPYLLRAEHVDSNGAYGSKSHFNEDDGRLEAHYFPLLHEGARHAIHATETLTLACGNLKALLEEQNPSNVALSIYRNINAARRVAQDLNFYYSRLCAFKARSESNLARVQNEIGLAFNVVAQRDTKITLELSRNATQDSRIMRQISFVTLIFLPGTAVSTLFSTSFFNFSPPSPANNNSNTSNEPNNQTGVWQVSDKFWIFWVITIPLTLATYMTWQWFQRGIDVTEFPVGSARGKVEDQVAPKNKWDRFRDIMPMAGFTDRKTRRAGSEENRDGPEDAGITTTRERRGGLDAARSYFGKRKAAGGEGEKEREKEDEQVV